MFGGYLALFVVTLHFFDNYNQLMGSLLTTLFSSMFICPLFTVGRGKAT